MPDNLLPTTELDKDIAMSDSAIDAIVDSARNDEMTGADYVSLIENEGQNNSLMRLQRERAEFGNQGRLASFGRWARRIVIK